MSTAGVRTLSRENERTKLEGVDAPMTDTRLSPKDPLLALAGSGRRLWAGEPGDEYVKRLRTDWDEPSVRGRKP
jgi:hypothetical protein